jgi:hypothetical protein
MPLKPDQLEIQCKGRPFGFSARRIYEHITLIQINPYGRGVASVRSRRDAAELIDVVRFDSRSYSLTGLTLAGLDDVALSARVLGEYASAVRRCAVLEAVGTFVNDVWRSVVEHAARRAARNLPSAFLPVAASREPFRVPLLRSRLCEYLEARAWTKARAAQWLASLRNLTTQGLRHEELYRSGLIGLLEARAADDVLLTGVQLMQAVDFSALRLSVIPNIAEARTQLRFDAATERPLPMIKGEARPQTGQQRQLRFFDRVLGYRIEEVEHEALWGKDRHWQAVTFDGKVLRNRQTRRAIFGSSGEAMARAQEHAREALPKLLASERWVGWSWTGGEEYREWLITLPWFPESYFSTHFSVRNILAHVRCDLREGADGEKVLMLHELQSDWTQDMRRRIQVDGTDAVADTLAPFLNEWPALTLKLMLLHAAHARVDAVGWTRGKHQEQRVDGRGRAGLMELYDRTLPREAKRMLKPFGLSCEEVDVYVPDNFRIRRLEAGYEVRTAGNAVLGVAASFQEARQLLPDGAHERLHGVHGVRLSQASRAAILENGFMAWG